jgi:sterol desaturase/sphingolipid hydroxylase (fatty acid hydroxylase superfamily)
MAELQMKPVAGLPQDGAHSLGGILQTMLQAITESRANYWASYVVDFACPLTLGYFGWRQATGWALPLASVCAGLFVFSFVEYVVHRWVFHSPASFLSPMHQTHHRSPRKPSAAPCLTSAAIAFVLWAVLSVAVGQQIACFFLCGLLGGYFCYAALHHLEHNTPINFLPFRWLKRRWAFHSTHHRLLEANYGVTTSLWDHVFGTDYQSRKRKAATRATLISRA